MHQIPRLQWRRPDPRLFEPKVVASAATARLLEGAYPLAQHGRDWAAVELAQHGEFEAAGRQLDQSLGADAS